MTETAPAQRMSSAAASVPTVRAIGSAPNGPSRSAPGTGSGPRRAAASQAVEATSQLKVPEWVKDAVFYQVFPERFENGDMGNDPQGTVPWGTPPTNDAMMGGDLQGITHKMGYLKALGVNALYLNPIFESPSNHKYNTTSYDRVDQHFGGDKAFTEMMDAAHRNGVKVMLDGVFNHVSHQHEWFRDVRENGPKSKHFDKFEVHNWPIRYERDKDGVLRSKDYKSWWGYATLPELRTEHPEVRDVFLHGKDAVVKKWITEGRIDGWRMDVADEVEADFWKAARTEIKKANPDAYMLAENWHDGSPMVQGDQFDGVMNYKHFQQPAVRFFAKKDVAPDEFVKQLQAPYSREAKTGMFNILDSHDTPRFITEAGGDWYRLRPAAIFQMTYVGAPVVYYGDEIAMEGAKDPDSRRTFEWDLVPGNRVKAGTRPARGGLDSALNGTDLSRKARAGQVFSLYQKLIATRKSEPALTRGDFTVLATHNEEGTLAYRRHLDDVERDAIVAINNNVVGKDIVVPMAGVAANGTKFTDALSGRSVLVNDGKLVLEDVDGNYGAVLLRDA